MGALKYRCIEYSSKAVGIWFDSGLVPFPGCTASTQTGKGQQMCLPFQEAGPFLSVSARCLLALPRVWSQQGKKADRSLMVSPLGLAEKQGLSPYDFSA